MVSPQLVRIQLFRDGDGHHDHTDDDHRAHDQLRLRQEADTDHHLQTGGVR
jgi:hypothetical protein